MGKLILFGASEAAELAHYYFESDSDQRPVAFTVDGRYCKDRTFCGLPLVPFEEIEDAFSPQEHALFVAVAYRKMNALRAEKVEAARAKGYSPVSYVSSRSIMLARSMGVNCFVQEGAVVQPFVEIGDNVTLWSGCHIGHHSRIGNNVFVAPNAAISGGVQIEDNAFIGVNATVRNHIRIGRNCVVGAGAVMLKDGEANAVYRGSPAAPTGRKSTDLPRL